jgi:hypothetical protein
LRPRMSTNTVFGMLARAALAAAAACRTLSTPVALNSVRTCAGVRWYCRWRFATSNRLLTVSASTFVRTCLGSRKNAFPTAATRPCVSEKPCSCMTVRICFGVSLYWVAIRRMSLNERTDPGVET